MIATIEGTLRARDGSRLVVAVGGVGFEIHVPLRILDALPPDGERVLFHIHLHVREDALTLYGFPDEGERRLFQTLLGVSGVGPKVALAVLSSCSAPELARLIHDEQTKTLMTFPGIGKKTAERIILELKDKIEMDRYLPALAERGGAAVAGRRLVLEAVAALESIGLSHAAAEAAVGAVDAEVLERASRVEEIVREALRKV